MKKQIITLALLLISTNVYARTPVRIIYNESGKRYSTENKQDTDKIAELFYKSEVECFKDKAETLEKSSIPGGFTCAQGKPTWVYSIKKTGGETPFEESVAIVCSDRKVSTTDISLGEVSSEKLQALKLRRNPSKCTLTFVVEDFENERENIEKLKKETEAANSTAREKKEKEAKKRSEIQEKLNSYFESESN